MKKAVKGIVVIVLMMIAFCMIYFVWYIHTPHKVTTTDAYEQYVYPDSHLISLRHQKDLGIKDMEISSIRYSMHYYRIKDVDEKDFVAAWFQQNAPLAQGHSVVLQHPKNTVQVLNDWDISKVELYYRTDGETDVNSGYASFMLCKDDRHILGSRTDERFFQEVRTLLSDENRVAASVSLHDRMYFEQWKTNQLHLRI